MIKIITAIIGIFNFRNREIAELHLQQQADQDGLVPIDEPYTDTVSGVLVLRQKCAREREESYDNS